MKPSIQHYFEFLSLLVSFLAIGKLKNSFLISFVPYLFIVLVVEILAKYVYITHHYNTAWMYNLMNLFSNLFYGFIFYSFAKGKRHKKTVAIITLVYVASSIVYISFTTFLKFNNDVAAAGGIIQVLFSCLYYYFYLQDDSYLKERHYASGLLIASGVLIFYVGIAICFSLFNYIKLHELKLFDTFLYNLIPRYLSIILYILISIALVIWKKPTQTLS